MTDMQKATELAAKLLRIGTEAAGSYRYDLPELNAWYFSVPVKGGDSIIVGQDMTVLYANSSVGFDAHVDAFRQGMRTPLELFDQEE